MFLTGAASKVEIIVEKVICSPYGPPYGTLSTVASDHLRACGHSQADLALSARWI